jgi:mRNA interferase RelE/StbE
VAIYNIRFKPRALKDLDSINHIDRQKILEKIGLMENDLQGDIKKLTNFTPEYRLRVGNYRVLFEIEEENIIIYRILHRRDSYK